jgi:uncharacterized protein (DUF697 family)
MRRYCVAAAVTSVAAHPVPAVDELFVVPVHYRFSWKMARVMNVPIRAVPWREVSKIIWGGALVRFGIDVTLGLVPVAGVVSHVLSAVTLTEILGEYLDRALTGPEPPPPVTLRTLASSVVERLRRAMPRKR